MLTVLLWVALIVAVAVVLGLVVHPVLFALVLIAVFLLANHARPHPHH